MELLLVSNPGTFHGPQDSNSIVSPYPVIVDEYGLEGLQINPLPELASAERKAFFAQLWDSILPCMIHENGKITLAIEGLLHFVAVPNAPLYQLKCGLNIALATGYGKFRSQFPRIVVQLNQHPAGDTFGQLIIGALYHLGRSKLSSQQTTFWIKAHLAKEFFTRTIDTLEQVTQVGGSDCTVVGLRIAFTNQTGQLVDLSTLESFRR